MRLQAPIRAGAIGLVYRTHRLAQIAAQLVRGERHRRIHGDPGARFARGREVLASQTHRILQDHRLHLLLVLRAAAHEDAFGFLERQQPERQPRVVHVDDLGEVAKGRRVLVVRVEQHHVRVGLIGENLRKNQRNGARFAASRRADDGEVLGEQLVDHDEGRLQFVVAELAHADAGNRWPRVDGEQVLPRHGRHRRAERGVARHAALEHRFVLRSGSDLADQTERENARSRADVEFDGVDDADNVAVSVYLDQRAGADGRCAVVVALTDRDDLRAADFRDVTE